MIKPELHPLEEERIKALLAYEILDTPAESEFDDIVKLASSICEAPISLITLVDRDRQWFKAQLGIEGSTTPRDTAFCAHAIHDEGIMVVEDATKDIRFHDNPFVTENPNIRFYAGMPLVTPAGLPLGTLCVIDTIPRTLTEDQLWSLKVLSRQIIKQLELKLRIKELKSALRQVNEQKLEIERLNGINARLQSVIGHDLRNSIHNSLSIFDLYRSGTLSLEEFGELSDKMYQILLGSANLLDNLQRWGVAQREGKEVNLEVFELDQVVTRVFNHLKPAADAKQNKLIYLGSNDNTIKADKDLLEVVLRNLTQNANKFTANGEVALILKKENGVVKLKIEDTGIGMSPALADRLFNWNDRQTTKGTGGEKGSGLGLLISKEFVEKMGGKIQITSQVGKGTQVSLIFPN